MSRDLGRECENSPSCTCSGQPGNGTGESPERLICAIPKTAGIQKPSVAKDLKE